MKIARLETFANAFVGFVRVTTDTGDEGWGQLSTYHSDITAQIFHRQVAPWALGAHALDGLDDLLDRITEPSRDRVTHVRFTPDGIAWLDEHVGGSTSELDIDMSWFAMWDQAA